VTSATPRSAKNTSTMPATAKRSSRSSAGRQQASEHADGEQLAHGLRARQEPQQQVDRTGTDQLERGHAESEQRQHGHAPPGPWTDEREDLTRHSDDLAHSTS
jgi:hypothetical protein